MKAILRTDDVARNERVDFWTRSLGQVCSGLKAVGYGNDTIDGRIKITEVGRMKLCDISASPHCVTLSPLAAESMQKSLIKIVYQAAGRSIYHQGGAEFAVNQGDWIIYDASRSHGVINISANRHFVIAVPTDLALTNDIDCNEIPLIQRAQGGGLSTLALTFVRSAIRGMSEIEPSYADEVTSTTLRLLRHTLYHGQTPEPPQSSRSILNQEIKRIIRKNLTNPDFTMDRIAQELGCSKRLLHQAFVGDDMTISEYLWASRLEHCHLELVKKQRRSITEIAFSSGFSSSSHFSRSFKIHFGYSPSSVKRV